MIRHPVTLPELRRRIEAEAPGWIRRATRRTEKFRKAGKYGEASNIWSEIKAVYMRLQSFKCAYCERRLASEDFGGAIEHDLEHYRPKGAVPAWPSAQIASERGISYRFATGDAFPDGYYLLAYHPFNYATACKKCNSPLKSSFFPVAGPRGSGSDDPAALQTEKPFLLYPIGDLDEDDPEEVLTFDGVIPVPKVPRGPRHRRARVTIDFFELDQREELWRGRAEVIVALFIALWVQQNNTDEKARTVADRAATTLLSSASAHTNCARSFRELYRRDPLRAEEIADRAQAYLDSHSP